MQFVINVEKGSDESIVRHRVCDALSDDAKIEGLVLPTHKVVLKADMHATYVDSQVFEHNLQEV